MLLFVRPLGMVIFSMQGHCNFPLLTAFCPDAAQGVEGTVKSWAFYTLSSIWAKRLVLSEVGMATVAKGVEDALKSNVDFTSRVRCTLYTLRTILGETAHATRSGGRYCSKGGRG